MRKLGHDNVTIIIGGGSIGLSVAYNLAKRYSTSSVIPKIIVIEAFEHPFTAASSTCTGCFHYEFLEPQTGPLLTLGKYSFELWAAEAEDAEFREATGYRAHSSFGINAGTGQGLEELPDWVQRESYLDVNPQVLGTHTATVNPIGVGKWLTHQCLNMGVDIITGWKVVAASMSTEHKVQAVTCLAYDQTEIYIECKQLLLACGPWTPTVYEMLFPSSPIRLQWTTDAGDWILCKNPCPTTRHSVAFVSFAKLVGDKMEFAGRGDGTIWACGRRSLTASLPPLGQLDKADERVVEELSNYARKWLNWSCDCVEKHAGNFQLVGKGRAFRPATTSGLPVISEVASSDLTDSGIENGKAAECSSGVFLCWGHGSWGLTLGMGSGRLTSQLMLGEKPDIDLSQFALHVPRTHTR